MTKLDIFNNPGVVGKLLANFMASTNVTDINLSSCGITTRKLEDVEAAAIRNRINIKLI